MRLILSLLFCLTMLTISCKKTTANYLIPEGTYVGTFQRLTSTGGQISNVKIIFTANTWTGQSQILKYPALCQGTYKASSSDNLTFENTCPWTAEFDWTLILSQDYKLKVMGNNVKISRDYSSGSKDIYTLTKQ
jgi:hypothetical protein